ncbi:MULTISPECIES: XTP/dITP diphosphatase [Bacillaceae]|uniref:XTP/dITP diphosphatase n=1 Tax=Bacillaceae TaxID=186817 RepID=UPI001BDE91CC|nr:XTP/dITP diphosphatase [Cytobacillus sp. IB215316]MDX8359382.1 XTP/dITP diphosphatase [Cytobacillus sp. IB215316]
MNQVLIATKNMGKVNEFKSMLEPKGIEVQSLFDINEPIDIEETGQTFAENAIIKAEAVANRFHTIVIADDSGLAVDALDGRPGVYSARYAGEHKDDQANLEKVLQELEGVPTHKRTGRFHCALAIAFPKGETHVVEGTCEGRITDTPVGQNGFGYDPIFYVEEKEKTMAQLSKQEKNEMSHRAIALKKLSHLWSEIFADEDK